MILLAFAAPARAADQDAQIYFNAVAGEEVGGEFPVLLRWTSFYQAPPVEEYAIYRKEGPANSANPMTLVSRTSKLRNVPLIRSLFEHPAQARAKANIIETLNEISSEPVTDENYADLLLAMLDGDADCEGCEFRRNMLINANYMVAIIEGMGYLDLAEPLVYTYELRTSVDGGTDNLVLGRASIDASVRTELPAPQQPQIVDVPGEKGHLKVFLYWDMSMDLFSRRTAMFGYNVYRGEGGLAGSDFETLMAGGQLSKINRVPILPPSGDALGTEPEDRYVFVDDNLTLTDTEQVGDPFDPGEEYTYWVAAIDLLGQDGEPSLPVEVIVPDKSVPQVPRGLSTRVVDVAGQDRVLLTWDRNADDTVSYNVYRFREWDHAGKKDAFPPVDGMTEGLVSSTPQPGGDQVPFFSDPSIQFPQHENMAFWYCVSAVDGWGNESAMSPPFRGVIFDTEPPRAPEGAQICVYYTRCVLVLGSIDRNPDLVPTQDRHVVVEFQIQREQTAREGRGSRIVVERITTFTATTAYVPPRIDTIFDGVFPGEQPLITIRDETPIPGQTTQISYRVTVYDGEGNVCGSYIVPDEKNQNLFRNLIVEGVNMTAKLLLRIDETRRCPPAATGTEPHDPYDDFGNLRPVTFEVPPGGDAAGVILYRSPDCLNYYQVAEVRFPQGGGNANIEDYFIPEQGGRICYGIRYFDENNNQSPIFYIPTQILFPSQEGSQIVPSMLSADPLGDETNPAALLRWFGSNVGVAAFRVEMATDEAFADPVGTIQLNPQDFSFNEEDSEFESAVDRFDEASGQGLSIDTEYFVRVVSVLQNGQERPSNNAIPFIWSADQTPHEHPNWPVRPLPPSGTGLGAVWLPPAAGAADQQPFSYGVGLSIGILDFTGQKETNAQYIIEPPFIVYRKRVDVPDRTYIQISPLIDSISANDRDVPIDPFFYSRLVTDNLRLVFYLDTVNLVLGAEYEYKIVKLDRGTGEIERVYGPSNAVEVQNP